MCTPPSLLIENDLTAFAGTRRPSLDTVIQTPLAAKQHLVNDRGYRVARRRASRLGHAYEDGLEIDKPLQWQSRDVRATLAHLNGFSRSCTLVGIGEISYPLESCLVGSFGGRTFSIEKSGRARR